MAAAVLQMMGFKNVLNLAGGYARWEAEGMPQVRETEYCAICVQLVESHQSFRQGAFTFQF